MYSACHVNIYELLCLLSLFICIGLLQTTAFTIGGSRNFLARDKDLERELGYFNRGLWLLEK